MNQQTYLKVPFAWEEPKPLIEVSSRLTLQEVGVWRVFCDTAVNNVGMISTFQRVGYRQYSEPYERPV
jgi:hypothetical protein